MRVIERAPNSATVQLTDDELGVIAQALNEVLNGPDAIEEWEFSTRMGADPHEAERPRAAIHAALSG